MMLAFAHTASMTDALTLATMTTVAMVPLLIASTAATGWQLVRRRRDIRFGRREALVMAGGTAAGIVVAVAVGVAAYHLTS